MLDDVVVPEQLELSFEEMPEESFENAQPKPAQEELPPEVIKSQTSKLSGPAKGLDIIVE